MTKYQYYISMVLDYGTAFETLKATTLKEARKQLNKLKSRLTKSFLKKCTAIELSIDRYTIDCDGDFTSFKNIYWQMIK